MTDIGKIYKLTVIRSADLTQVRSFDRSFFDEFEAITEITDHRIVAKVEKHRKKEPNTAEVTIYNLAESTRSDFVRSEAMKVRLEAGYDNLLRLVFIGDLRHARNVHDGTEWLTTLQLGDGARAFAQARTNRSYEPGTPISTVLAGLAKDFRVAVPSEVFATPELQERIAAGEVLVGSVADELTRLLAQFGFEWSFQDGRLRIVKFDGAHPGTIRLISEEDGMIGSPVIDPPKIRAAPKTPSKRVRVPKLTVQHTLFPELAAAEKFRLQSRGLNGTFIIDHLTHELDTFGDEWRSTIEATEAT